MTADGEDTFFRMTADGTKIEYTAPKCDMLKLILLKFVKIVQYLFILSTRAPICCVAPGPCHARAGPDSKFLLASQNQQRNKMA
jgi:hypothetical protein